jgi:hypothetical protein
MQFYKFCSLVIINPDRKSIISNNLKIPSEMMLSQCQGSTEVVKFETFYYKFQTDRQTEYLFSCIAKWPPGGRTFVTDYLMGVDTECFTELTKFTFSSVISLVKNTSPSSVWCSVHPGGADAWCANITT